MRPLFNLFIQYFYFAILFFKLIKSRLFNLFIFYIFKQKSIKPFLYNTRITNEIDRKYLT